ncbi:cobaltochelatase subunit CobN [Thalassotalea sp. 1_MG-2023]|uniref:cobaltochelatase subunit CobN n=1 Tax=Thalassotalea sp. 1_MG-2023 TaxID=3062680 RepID=UPI0026E35B94|nr:cobaltochelatase subunit CobN [Thalassotalea sp. 1_MG-2023]MDO6426688.1 cobaltochelatase subunit CobN [Thalassotalea sp. 1_MG-2023]
MNTVKLFQKFKYLLLLLITIVVVAGLYRTYMSPTRIALINYQDFQAARMFKAKDSDWISIDRVNKADVTAFTDYDVIYIFGRGLSLTPEQVTAFKYAGNQGVSIVVESATNPRIDVTNVPASLLSKITAYFKYGGEFNYQQLLRFSRTDLDQKTFGVDAPKLVKENTTDVLFHKDETQLFSDVEGYQNYYETLESYQSQGKKIALLTSVPGPFNANRDHLDALIDKFEADGFRVYPIASSKRRLPLIKEINPDAVVMMPHGRMQLGNGQQTIDFLKSKNIPLFAPVSVFEHYDKWLKNRQGFSDSLLTMNVVMPELDGAIVPYAINAQFFDDNNFQIFKAMPKRLNNFSDMVSRWLKLKSVENNNKKLAIVYFRGPGKNALVAGNMEVAPSLFNTLQHLKKQGYNLGNLPDDYTQFKHDLNRQGAVMAPYAQGAIEKFMLEGKPALVPATTYQSWCNELLADGLCDEINTHYGQAPGNFMVTRKQDEKQSQSYIAVARLKYGNIVLVPQPLPGLGEDTFKLVHGTRKAPPHSYIAPYLWIREQFNADAILHYGTHGSLEFTQGKQVALSEYDWADALIGNTPHFYIYTMSNVGEAIIAKRRSYATILSHLTAPFKESGIYSELKTLSELAMDYNQVTGSVRKSKKQQINQLLEQHDLLVDLEIAHESLQLADKDWQQRVLLPLSKWLETIAQAKISSGLYTLGTAYSAEQAKQTAHLMALDTLTDSYEKIVKLSNLASDQNSRILAKEWISRVFQGEKGEEVFNALIPVSLQQRAEVWFDQNKQISQSEIIKSFIAMSENGKKQKVLNLSHDALMQLTAEVISDTDSKAFILSLKNEQSFGHVSKALDPQAREKAKLLAKVIPAIATAIEQLEKPKVAKLVNVMQQDENRQQVLSWLSSDDLAEKIANQKAKNLKTLHSQLAKQLPNLFQITSHEATWLEVDQKRKQLLAFKQQLDSEPSLLTELSGAIEKHTGLSEKVFQATLDKKYYQLNDVLAEMKIKEQTLAMAIKHFKTGLLNLQQSRQYLLNGAAMEFSAISNALKGGYTAPSSGGDPVLNPSALPTGRNMYAIDAEKTPSEAAWQVGKSLAEDLLASHLDKTGNYPKKVSFTLWPSEFIHTQGATIAEILFLLGVEPVRDPFGRVKNLALIPAEKLMRPRIDVVVQSAGQLRDIAASRLALIERAVRMVADAKEDSQENYVAKGVRDAEKYMLAQGVSPLEAKMSAYRRSFGGVNGAYGTAIMSKVEGGEYWQTDSDIAKQYLENMGAVYGDSETWGDYNPHLFAAALQNTEVVIQPRSSNTWGALSLDHVYEFMGGLNLAVREVTGKDPQAYFNDYRNPNKAKLSTLHETIWTEMRTTLLNPTYIRDLMKGEASSAETFAETFRNTYGWNVMKPDAIDNSVWNNLYDVYVQDSKQLNVQEFFERENPFALQEMTGVMLETARKGLWQASDAQLKAVSQLHAKLVSEFEAGCGGFTCGNASLQAFIKKNISDQQLKNEYQQQLEAAQVASSAQNGVVLTKQGSKAEQTAEQTKTSKKTKLESASNVSSTNWFWLLLALPLLLLLVKRKRHA